MKRVLGLVDPKLPRVVVRKLTCAQMREGKNPVASPGGAESPTDAERHFPVAKNLASSVRFPY